MAQQHVFISYAWGGESEKVADEIETQLKAEGIDLIRDKVDLGFKGLIREFMAKIGQGNLVVLIISDKYLKSKNCMFELLEVAKKGEFHKRVFPIVLPDANIYDSLVLIDYYHFWQQKISELNAKIKTLNDLSDTRKILEELDLYTNIRGAIDDLAGRLSNMNTLTLEIMRSSLYQPLIHSLRSQSGKAEKQPQKPIQPNKKEGKILYHIPGMMQVDRWTRCTVRLAWEELLLKEGLKIPDHEQIIESIRLGNVMQVSLNEGRDGQNFDIKFLNNEEQVIFEDDFTEWLFDIKARTIGNFTLILRVTLVQIIEGKERKKDIVLERDVVTEAIVPTALAQFEIAEKGLSLASLKNESSNSMVTDLSASQALQRAEKFEEPIMASPIPDDQLQPHIGAGIPRPNQPTYDSPPSKKSLVKRVLPYAASLVVLMVVSLFVLEINESSVPESMLSKGSSENTYSDIKINPDQNKLVAFDKKSTTPSGETTYETVFFVVSAISFDSLQQIDLGNFSIRLPLSADTTNQNLGVIKQSSILKIQDSLQKVSTRPSVFAEKLIEGESLKVSTESQIIRTHPKHIDSVTSQKLKIKTRRVPQN